MSGEAKAKKKPQKKAVKDVAKVESKPRQQNIILVGRKPVMNYVLATIIQFNQGAEDVVIKARGMALSRAVDVAEIVRRRFLEGSVEVRSVEIGTDMVGEGGDTRNVSTIDITLGKIK